jgi:hypothetical protein
MDHPGRFPPEDRHVQGVDDELGAHVIRHRPTDDAAAEDVQHDAKNKKPDQVRM